MDIDYLKTWIGRQETVLDLAAPSPLARLSALLDHDQSPWADGAVPPLGHWLYFLPDSRQSQIGADGHPKLGGFLPPIGLPRRMWAGGRLTWAAPLPLGAEIRRITTIQDVTPKRGASGEMVFVTLRHDVYVGDVLALS
jgi:3-methylfumaryl-CoA hydratase